MRLATTTLGSLLLGASLVLGVPTADAQPKAPPPGMDTGTNAPGGPKKGPRTLQNAQQEQQAIPEEMQDAWRDAYESDDFPVTLILIGMDRRAFDPTISGAQGGRGGATGVADQGGAGSNLSFFDRSGITEQLASELRRRLREGNPDFDDIDVESMSELDRADVSAKAQADELETIGLLTTKVNADLVLYAKLQPVPGSLQRGSRDVPYKIITELKDYRRGGRVIASDAYDYTGGTDINRVRAYSAAVYKSLIPQYIDYVENRSRSMRYQVRIFGLDGGGMLNEVERTLEDMDNVRGSIRSSYRENATDGASYGEMRVRFRGDLSDLAYEAQELLREEMGLETRIKSQNADTLELQAVGFVAPEASGATQVVDSGRTTGGGVMDPMSSRPWPWRVLRMRDRANFQMEDAPQEYQDAGRPKIAVQINTLVTPGFQRGDGDRRFGGDARLDGQTLEGDSVTVMRGEERTDDRLLATTTMGVETMEAEIVRAMLDLDLDAVDGNTVRAMLARDADMAENVTDEAQVAEVLKRMGGVDILMYGLANIRPGTRVDIDTGDMQASGVVGGNADDARTIQYTFTIRDVRNGQMLGTVNYNHPDPRAINFRDFPVNPADEASVGAYVAGRLLEQTMTRLERGRSLELLVKTDADARVMMSIGRSLEDNLPSIVKSASNPTFSNGVGRLTVRYVGSYRDLFDGLIAVEDQLPFSVVVDETNPSQMTVALKPDFGQ
ncbi:MAG: hypothetical protein AAGF84_00210 [Planctomycetota bacterium]